MATKAEVLEALRSGDGCLGRAALDEPVFILSAKTSLHQGWWFDGLTWLSRLEVQ
jgi:hypothetical protein